MSTELQNLSIDEVSGVDNPANSIPGWMVMKSADGAIDPNAVLKAAESQLGAVYATLAGATVLDSAPEDVTKARDTLTSFIEKELNPEPTKPTLLEKLRSTFTTKAVAPAPTQVAVVPAVAEPTPVAPITPVEKQDATPVVATEPVVKAEDIDAFRTALVSLADRMQGIEKHLAGSAQPDGQDGGDVVAPVQKSTMTPLQGSVMKALQGERVTIS